MIPLDLLEEVPDLVQLSLLLSLLLRKLNPLAIFRMAFQLGLGLELGGKGRV